MLGINDFQAFILDLKIYILDCSTARGHLKKITALPCCQSGIQFFEYICGEMRQVSSTWCSWILLFKNWRMKKKKIFEDLLFWNPPVHSRVTLVWSQVATMPLHLKMHREESIHGLLPSRLLDLRSTLLPLRHRRASKLMFELLLITGVLHLQKLPPGRGDVSRACANNPGN